MSQGQATGGWRTRRSVVRLDGGGTVRGELSEKIRTSDRSATPVRRLVGECVVPVAVSAAFLVLGGSRAHRGQVLPVQVGIGLTVIASVVVLAVAVLCFLVARLTEDWRGVWCGSAFAVYGLIAVPATTVGSAVEAGRASFGSIRLVAHIVTVALLIIGTCPFARRRHPRITTLVWIGVSLPLLAGVLSLMNPSPALALTSWFPVRLAVSVCWLSAAFMMAYRGLVHGLPSSFRFGLGVVVIAVAHTVRVWSEPAQPAGLPGTDFTTMRLIGLAVVLSGIVELAGRVLRVVYEAHFDHQEELLAVEEGLARRAERDHDLRNGIAGIAGATDLLGGGSDSAEQARLRTVVNAELVRLDALLSPGRPGAPAGRYEFRAS